MVRPRCTPYCFSPEVRITRLTPVRRFISWRASRKFWSMAELTSAASPSSSRARYALKKMMSMVPDTPESVRDLAISEDEDWRSRVAWLSFGLEEWEA